MPRNMDNEDELSQDEDDYDFNELLDVTTRQIPDQEVLGQAIESSNASAGDSDDTPGPSQETEPVREEKEESNEDVEDESETADKMEESYKDESGDDEDEDVSSTLEGSKEENKELDDEEEPETFLDDRALVSDSSESESSESDITDDETESTVELTPFQQSVLDSKLVINSIRREEFGVGMELEDNARRLMDRQHERIGRSLKRLSEELYSKDTHFVLELIQNADDNDYEDSVNPSLVFIVDRSEVVVRNNEIGFSESNIRALCDVGKSTKGKHKRGYIGHKGIGFKSVFRVTDKPEIKSKGYHICFDRSSDQMGYILPTWMGPAEPEEICQMEEPTKQWTTQIALPLKGDIQRTTSLINKFDDVQPSLLLFLNRLKSIVIINKEENTTSRMTRKDKGGNVVEIRHSKTTDSWLLVKKCLDATELQRARIESTELGLAFPLSEGIPTEQNVFAYLPLRSYGFHFIIQGDFDIPSSREDVDGDSAWNQWLRQEIAPLFIEALEAFKTHYSEDSIKAVCRFLKFVPLQSQITTEFFKKVAVDIHKKLKATACMPVLTGETQDEISWILPSQIIMCKDQFVREVIPSHALKTHRNCYYLHQHVVESVSDVLLKSLGVKVLMTDDLIDILSSVVSTGRKNGEFLSPKSVAKWLTCVFRSRERDYDVTENTLDRLRTIPMIPLSSGRVIAMNEESVFFPISEEDEDQFHSGYSAPLQALESDMSTLDGRVLNSLDQVANSQILQLLEELGVRRISPRDVIQYHIMPVIQSDKWKMKSREVMIGYVVFIKENLQKQPDVCNLDNVAESIHVITNHGLIKPRDKPVHFTIAYGNPIDLSIHLPGCDWVLLDSCYLFHRGPRQVTQLEVKQWHSFFSKLGVLDYLAVEKKIMTVKVDELDATPWADVAKFWKKPTDGVYKIHDHICKEFDELIQADLTNLQDQRQNLLTVLQQEWNNYTRYMKALVFDQAGIKLSDTESTFALHLKMSPWLPSTGLTENKRDVVFRSPGQVFLPTQKARDLLGDHVPYLISGDQTDPSGMLHFIGVKSSGVIDVEFLTAKLLGWCCDEPSQDVSVKTSFVTSLGHIIRVYQYLEQNCRPQEFTTLFSDHRVVFLPSVGNPQSLEHAVKGQFVHKALVYWRDRTDLLGKYDASPRSELGSLYPRYMEEFFLRKVGVDDMPTLKEYAQLLVECANVITLPDNARIKSEILPLYQILGYKCVRSDSEIGQTWGLSASDADGVDPTSAKFVKNILDDQTVFPVFANKWVTLKENPLICDSHSVDLEKLFLDKKEVHLLNLGDRDRLGRVVQDINEPSANQHVKVFLEACGIEKLSDCIKEEFITQLTQPSLQLQLFLYKVCPYVQLYMSTKRSFHSVYEKLRSEVNIAAKLKVMRFMEAKTLEKIYRFKHDQDIFAKETVECGLQELTEFYVAVSISQKLRDSSSVRREVAKLFSCGDVEIQNDLFSFLGSLLLALGNKKMADDEVDKTICKDLNLAPLQDGEEPWKIPKPIIPEAVVKPVKVKTVSDPKPQQATANALPEDDDAGIHSWPPKSCAYGPQQSTKGSQNRGEEGVLKMWPPPAPPASVQQALFPKPLGPGQPTIVPINQGTALQQGGNPDGASAVHPPSVVTTGGNRSAQPTGQGSHRDSLTVADYIQPPLDGVTVKVTPSTQAQQETKPDENQLTFAPAEEGVEAASEEEEWSAPSDNDVSSDESEEESDVGKEEEKEEEEEEEGETEIQEDEPPPHPEFHSPPSVQRLAAASHPSSGSVKKFFVPPFVEGDPLEVEFEDLAQGPALLSNLTDADLPPGEDVDATEIARWGENLVYSYLVQNAAEQGLSEVKVHWVNQYNESGEPYDIVINDGSGDVFVEVKSTVKDKKQVVEISPKEVAFAQEKGELFHLYRVFNVGNARGLRLCRLQDLSHRMNTKQVKLFMYL